MQKISISHTKNTMKKTQRKQKRKELKENKNNIIYSTILLPPVTLVSTILESITMHTHALA